MSKHPMFASAEELQAAIGAYFAKHDGSKPVIVDGVVLCDKNGNPVHDLKPPTMAGLAHSLGFVSRQSLYDYKAKKDYTTIIQRARLRIEEFAEEQLYTNAKPAGPIFALKNMGWSDKQEIKHDVSYRVMPAKLDKEDVPEGDEDDGA